LRFVAELSEFRRAPPIAKLVRGPKAPTQRSPRLACLHNAGVVAPVARLAIVTLLVSWPSAGAATTLTVTLTSSHDTTLYGGDDETGFSNGAGAYLFAGSNNQRELRHGLVSFDLTAAIPPGSTVTSAVLRLFVTRTQIGDQSIEIHRVTASWGEASSHAGGNEGGGTPAAEGDATWSHRLWPRIPWTNPGGDFFPTSTATATVGAEGTTAEWQGPGMVDDVQRWLSDPTTNFGWMLVSADASVTISKRFGAHEGPRATRPQLAVTFTPPASPVGACCGTRGSCGYALDPGTSCAGLYQGAGSLCDPGTCPPPTAACCRADVTAACDVQTESACAAGGGVWSDSVESCADNPCPVVLTPFVDELPLLPTAARGPDGRCHQLAAMSHSPRQ